MPSKQLVSHPSRSKKKMKMLNSSPSPTPLSESITSSSEPEISPPSAEEGVFSPRRSDRKRKASSPDQPNSSVSAAITVGSKPRLWNEAYTAVLLRSLLEFRDRTGSLPDASNRLAFFDSIKQLLPKGVTLDQTYTKIRHTRNGFLAKNGANFRDQTLVDLCAKLWGTPVAASATAASTSPIKHSGRKKGIADNIQKKYNKAENANRKKVDGEKKSPIRNGNVCGHDDGGCNVNVEEDMNGENLQVGNHSQDIDAEAKGNTSTDSGEENGEGTDGAEDSRKKAENQEEGQKRGLFSDAYPFIGNAALDYCSLTGYEEDAVLKLLERVNIQKLKELEGEFKSHWSADMKLRAKKMRLRADIFEILSSS